MDDYKEALQELREGRTIPLAVLEQKLAARRRKLKC